MLEGRPKEVQMTVHRALYSAIAGVGLLAATAAADPQPWPTRAMQVISPFTAGNANDSIARVVLDQVSRQVGQPFVIENKPGGGGTIGAAMVAKADPDGYTILLSCTGRCLTMRCATSRRWCYSAFSRTCS